jgi:hypothetical protein
MMSIAFGQKGRSEMRLFEIPITLMSLVGLCLFSGLEGPPAQADFVFGEPVNLGPPVNSAYVDLGGLLSPDGRELYFTSDRPGGYGGGDIYVTRRASPQDPWGPPANLGPQINSADSDGPGSLSTDGLTLYVGLGWDLCTTTRATKDAPWGPRVRLGPVVVPSTSYLNAAPLVTADGLELFFCSRRPGGYGGIDVWVSTRATSAASWETPVNLGSTINGPASDVDAWVSPDGLMLLLCSDRPGGFGGLDMWITTRASRGSAWGAPRNLGPSINTIYTDWITAVSPDGWCYIEDFLGPRPGGLGGYDVWQASITPVVDFNGDGKVDAADMAVLVDNWGKSNSLCDIGPFPLGDGVVDEKDLAVLMESLVTPSPKASDVPCDVALSWVSPSFAESCDVYFGTSLDDVSNATRDDPRGVLVRLGQPGTTYDPDGPLEYSRTYYWRVDPVAGPAAAAIYPGPVLSFTTEPYAYPIQNLIATASSAQPSMGPEKTIDSSGLTGDLHDVEPTTMWLSTGAGPNWIQYEFDKMYQLYELKVWNSNQLIESFLGFGARTVTIETSTDGTTWTPVADVPEFSQAPGAPGYAANTTVSLGGTEARYVKLTITANWGGLHPQTGLAEVRFFYVPDRSATRP